MRFVLVSLTLLGFIASGLALREHYRTDTSPCSINERWDCGIVNHSPFAVLAGIPVAVIGMAGYVLLAALALKRAYRLFLAAALWVCRFHSTWHMWRLISSGCGASTALPHWWRFLYSPS